MSEMEETSYQTTIPLQNWTQTHNTLIPTSYIDNIWFITNFSIALLGMGFVVYGIYSLVKMDQSSSVFVMNLFICDLIQTSSRLFESVALFVHIKTSTLEGYLLASVMTYFYIFGVMVNICFMVCISAERYIIIAHPVWYRTKHTTRKSVFVSVAVWIMSAIILIPVCQYAPPEIIATLLLLPYPLVIFFLVGTWRALSRSTVPHNDQRRIMGILALILCTYTALFFPFTLYALSINLIQSGDFFQSGGSPILLYVVYILIALNPLFDFLIYLLMRKDAKDLLCALSVRCRGRQEENRDTDNGGSPTLEGAQV